MKTHEGKRGPVRWWARSFGCLGALVAGAVGGLVGGLVGAAMCERGGHVRDPDDFLPCFEAAILGAFLGFVVGLFAGTTVVQAWLADRSSRDRR